MKEISKKLHLGLSGQRMKYLSFLLLLISTHTFSQSYGEKIHLHRETYKANFLKDERSPIKQDDLQYLSFYDADSSYAVVAEYRLISNANPFIMPVLSGAKGSEYLPYALLKFKVNENPFELTVYRNTRLAKLPQYKDYLFLPFTDQSTGNTTYEGGRYLDLREGDFREGSILIDFNKAYNPYCAFGAGYACPKPPENNHLEIMIEAGEQKYKKGH